ncbi:hypothetical protein K3495_g403 [Podosphaera aphanis]|nr:hypothetical protein K3495_g403 [Podosphaera aphanis]
MLFFKKLWTAALLQSIATAKPAVEDGFQRFYSKPPPVKLDDFSYSKLTAVPRDYSVAILLTAMDAKFGCRLCHDFDPEWKFLSKSWTKGDKQGDSRLVFGTLDFTEGKNTFQALGLRSAPVLLLFRPTEGDFAVSDASPTRLEFTSGPLKAEQVYAWIARHLPDRPLPSIQRPFNWYRLASFMSASLGIIIFTRLMWSYISPIIQSRNFWAAISLISILLFTSGHMFNHIRKVPYVMGNGKGGISYFAGGFSNQLGMETQIVAILYGTLSIATIALALKIPRISDPALQQIAILAWGAIIFFVYSFLLSIFRIKNGAYPFWYPPFV